MECRELRAVAALFLDGELDAERAAAVERHARACAACREELDSAQRLSLAVRESASYHLADDALRARVRAAVGARSPKTAPAAARPSRWTAAWSAFGGAAVAFAAAALLLRPFPARDEPLDAHLRSLRSAALVDVVSTDKHTVKPWFAGKLDFTPPVADPKDAGFSLEGGRVDYLDGREVAALVYKRRKHLITVFVWPQEGEVPPAASRARGYNLLLWRRGGFAYQAVSDLAADELQQLASVLGQG